ncbi:MAG: hypothetical protein ABSG83_10415 [Roseiarcus sp.]
MSDRQAAALLRVSALRAKLGSSNHFDIDFSLADQPQQSLQKAFAACAAWIVATRDPLVMASPIREFIDPRPAPVARPGASRWGVSRPVVPTAGLAAVVVVAALLVPKKVIQEPQRPVDERPGQSALFLGNSRIFANDLPKMVRDVADSARSPVRYDVHMRAWGGATLRQHWGDQGDQDALKKPWGTVILQAESGAFGDYESTRDFTLYGQKLIRAAQDNGSQVALMANWTLGPSHFNGEDRSLAGDPKLYGQRIEQCTRALAGPTGAGVIDLERAFDEAAEEMPDVGLTSDGNHPSHAGTFLAALVIYGYLSHADLKDVSWRPYDMSRETAAQLKEIAGRHLH